MTKNQKLFVNEYLIDLNATRAYKKAYSNIKNDDTARANASRLLTNANIKNEIEKRMKDREKRTEVTQDKVVKELARLAFTDRTSIVKVTSGSLKIKSFDELTEDQKACISGAKETKFGIEVTFYNKEKALEMLGRHLGLFNDKLEVKGQVNVSNPFSGLSTEELKKVIFNEDK
ncbi:terminase small subunit [Fusobacterium varium]|uniref:terminase small subunit n=1 Tax=Fusobacterium varium TaxID=856 RepID=UPI002FEFD7BB